MRRIIFLVFLFLAACSNIPEPTATVEPAATDVPTNTPEPTATNTPQPTDTPTVTPTPEPVPGIPLVWMLPLIEAIQEVEVDATYVTGPCSDPEYSEFGECVVAVDFCPEDVCTQVLLVFPIRPEAKENPERMESFNSVPAQVLGQEYFIDVYLGTIDSKKFLLSETEAAVYFCHIGQEDYSGDVSWPFAAWKVSDALAVYLIESLGMREFPPEWFIDGWEDCG